jgi:hypothetical protein
VRCAAITSAGERCKLDATNGSYCWSHDPENADERRRRARRGGKARGAGELSEIKRLLEDLTSRVLKVEGVEPLETGPAAVANQLINTRLRAIEQERKVKETEDLEARIEALERAGGAGQKGARKWGA